MRDQLQATESFFKTVAGAWIAACLVILCCAQERGIKPEAAVKVSTPPANSAPPDVAAPPPDAQKRASGVASKILKPGRGKDRLEDNDCMKVSYTSWKRDGSLVSKSMGDDQIQCLNTAMPGVASALK